MPKTKVTIKDVTREADVNPSVVSRVLNKRFDAGRGDERTGMEAAAQAELRPNRMARYCAQKSKMIAVLISKFKVTFALPPYWKGRLWCLQRERLYHLRFQRKIDRKKGQQMYRNRVYEYGMDGAILKAALLCREKTLRQLRYSSVT